MTLQSTWSLRILLALTTVALQVCSMVVPSQRLKTDSTVNKNASPSLPGIPEPILDGQEKEINETAAPVPFVEKLFSGLGRAFQPIADLFDFLNLGFEAKGSTTGQDGHLTTKLDSRLKVFGMGFDDSEYLSNGKDGISYSHNRQFFDLLERPIVGVNGKNVLSFRPNGGSFTGCNEADILGTKITDCRHQVGTLGDLNTFAKSIADSFDAFRAFFG